MKMSIHFKVTSRDKKDYFLYIYVFQMSLILNVSRASCLHLKVLKL